MRVLCIGLAFLISQSIFSQELFVVTDPASNIPANSLSVRLGNSLFKEKFENGYFLDFDFCFVFGLEEQPVRPKAAKAEPNTVIFKN